MIGELSSSSILNSESFSRHFPKSTFDFATTDGYLVVKRLKMTGRREGLAGASRVSQSDSVEGIPC